MQSDKKKVLTNSLLYTCGNVLLKFFSFLLIPLYTAFISPEQYGELNLALGFVNVLSLVIMSGLQYSVIRYYADLRHSHEKVRNMISTVINSVAIWGILMTGILIISSSYWTHLIFDTITFFPIVFLAILISLISGIFTVYQDILKGMQQAKKSIFLSYLFFFSLLGLNIITVVLLKKGTSGILLSTLIVNVLMVCIMICDLIKQGFYRIVIDKSLLKELCKYSLPLVPHTLSFSISNLFSRIVINSRLSTSLLGIYSLASQFGGVADVVSNSVQSAFQPWLFSKLNNKEDNKEYYNEIRNLTNQLLWLYGLIYLIIGCYAKETVELMTAVGYHSVWKYIPFIIMVVAIKSPLYFYQNFMYYHKHKTKYVFICTLIGCAISMFLVWYLTPVYGIYGTIIADMIALCLRLFITRWILRDVESVYIFSHILYTTIFSIIWLVLAVLPCYLEIITSTKVNVIYKSFMIILYGVMVMNVCGGRPSEVKNKLKKILNI